MRPVNAGVELESAASVGSEAITAYYDSQVRRKLRDFVDTNRRIEAAWSTIVKQAVDPTSVLEIGCGVGAVCWRMATQWPRARIIGCDISPESIRTAQRLFERNNLEFVHDSLDQSLTATDCDLVVMMDVIEHVPVADRPLLYQRLGRCLGSMGRILLTFPTPAHQRWIRATQPELLQPVDEDVTMDVLTALGDATDTHLTFFQEMSVWTVGDYAHAVFKRQRTGEPSQTAQTHRTSLSATIRSLLHDRASGERATRLRLVKSRLGIDLDSRE